MENMLEVLAFKWLREDNLKCELSLRDMSINGGPVWKKNKGKRHSFMIEGMPSMHKVPHSTPSIRRLVSETRQLMVCRMRIGVWEEEFLLSSMSSLLSMAMMRMEIHIKTD